MRGSSSTTRFPPASTLPPLSIAPAATVDVLSHTSLTRLTFLPFLPFPPPPVLLPSSPPLQPAPPFPSAPWPCGRQRLGCHVAQGAANQIKYYFLWKLAESANSLSGFDFLGYAPDGSARWGRSVNVRLRGMWLSDSATIVPTHWNLRTGIFLKHYVYERLVGGGRPGFAHILVTQVGGR
eukprot:364569-Chlamydomonas_euryale.AAC.20